MSTMKDVAKAAGVSIATVSAVISGTSYVSPALAAKVTAAINALGYERNSVASGLKRGRTSLIGLVVSDVTNPFFTELVDVVQERARENGYSVLLGISNHDLEQEAALLRLMRSHQAEGTILCPTGNGQDYHDLQLGAGRMKIVVVDNASTRLPFDTITLDNRAAAEMAAQHILSYGHQRVAIITGPSHQFVSEERLNGFRAAMIHHGLQIEPSFIRSGAFRIQGGYEACAQILALPKGPTALFVANNLMLIGVMKALAEAGVSVPDGISLTSIDDFPWASAFHPALTVVRQPIEEMAAAAFGLLQRRMEGELDKPQHLVFMPELLIRKSCSPPRKGLS